MKLFKGFFNKKKKLSKYKDEKVKLLKFENDLTDVVPVSYNGLFSILDSSNAGSLSTINKYLHDFSHIDEENFELFYKTLNIDQEFVLNYLDRDKLNHDLLIEWININKATEIKKLEQELALVEAHIASNEEKIKKLGKKVENYEEEYEQQIHKKNLLDNPVISGVIILILTFTDFYVVENALEQIFFTANPLFLYLSSAIFAIGLDVSVYHMGCQCNEVLEIFKNKRATLDLAIFTGSYFCYVLLKIAVILGEDMDTKLILGNIALIFIPLLTSILSFVLSLKTKQEERESLINTLEMNNVDLTERANELRLQLYELQMAQDIDLSAFNEEEASTLEDLVLTNTNFLKNHSQFEIANKINSQEGTDYLTKESKVNDKGDINHEELKNINNINNQPIDA